LYPAIYLARHLLRLLRERVSHVSFVKIPSSRNIADPIAKAAMRECLARSEGEWKLPSEYKDVFYTVSRNRESMAAWQDVRIPSCALVDPEDLLR
jgi:hypothetical protein